MAMSWLRQWSTSSKSGSTPGQSQPLVCCCLVAATTDTGGDVTRQCIVVDLGEKASKALQTSCNPPLALLTNHSTIPSLSHVGEWKLHVGSLRESPKRPFNLREKNFSLCVSCCGQSTSSAANAESACRLNGDWILLVFAQEFVTKLCLTKLLFPLLPDPELAYLQTALKSNQFCMYQQTLQEGAVQIPITMQPANLHTPEDTKDLETDVRLYKEASVLRFSPSDPAVVIEVSSSSGSPICYLDGKNPPDNQQFHLLGMVCPILPSQSSSTSLSAEANCAQEMKMLSGVTTFHIVQSAITDGAHSKLVPCLSFLDKALKYKMCQNVAIQKLISCLERCKEDLDLAQITELLVFLLKEMPPLVNETRRPSITGHNALKIQLHAKLLTVVFSSFRGVDAALVSGTDHSGDHPPCLHTRIETLCKQIQRLMECSAEQETEGVIQAGFELCEEVLYFTYPDGPALLLVSSKALKIARNLRERYRQNAAIQRTYATMLEKSDLSSKVLLQQARQESYKKQQTVAQQIQRIEQESEQQAVRMQSLMVTERQQSLEKIQEQDAQLVAVQREMDIKEQVITRLESRVQEERIAKECLTAEQKHWQEERTVLMQERECFQQEKQQWVQQNEELKEESIQHQQTIHNLKQQLQEIVKEKRCLKGRNEVLMQEASDKNAEMEQLKTNNRKLSEESDKQTKELCDVKKLHQEYQDQIQKLQQEQQDQIQKLQQEQQDQIQKLQQEHKDQVQKLQQEWQEQIQKLQQEHQDQVQKLQHEHQDQVQKLQQEWQEQQELIQKLQQDHQDQIQKLQREHQDQVHKLQQEWQEQQERQEQIQNLHQERKEEQELIQKLQLERQDQIQKLQQERQEQIQKLQQGRKEEQDQIQKLQREHQDQIQKLQQEWQEQQKQIQKLQPEWQEQQEWQEERQKLQQERQEQIQNSQKENQCLNGQDSPRSLRKHLSLPSPRSTPHSSPYMAHRAVRPSLASDEDSKDFWKRDVSKLFESDLGLRDKVCALFRKVEGGLGEGSWEHLLQYLQEKFHLQMDATALDSFEIGGVMLSILKEWAKKEDVTVRRFCDVSKEIGIPRVEGIMQEAFAKFKLHYTCSPDNYCLK